MCDVRYKMTIVLFHICTCLFAFHPSVDNTFEAGEGMWKYVAQECEHKVPDFASPTPAPPSLACLGVSDQCVHICFLYTHSLQNTKEECELYEKSVASVRCHTLSRGDKTCVQSQGNVVTLLKCSSMLRKQSEQNIKCLKTF